MQIFVTGGTGFVGANLVRLLLQEGYQVRVLVRATSRLDSLQGLDVDCVEGDLMDPDLARSLRGCQALFHVAAHYSLWQSARPQLYRCNVEGTRNVLSAARQAGVDRTVYTSSVAAIGVNPNADQTDETYQSSPEQLIGHYKRSKYWAEQEAIRAVQAGQDIVIVNPTSPLGAWDSKPTPTGDIVLRFLRGQMPAYVNTGLNFVDVRDVAWGHLLALQQGKTGDRYILGHQNLTLRDLLQKLAAITGMSAPRYQIPAWLPLAIAWVDETLLAPLGKSPSVPLDGVRMATQRMYYDASKAIRTLGMPQTPIDSALQEAVDWFVQQGYVRPPGKGVLG